MGQVDPCNLGISCSHLLGEVSNQGETLSHIKGGGYSGNETGGHPMTHTNTSTHPHTNVCVGGGAVGGFWGEVGDTRHLSG